MLTYLFIVHGGLDISNYKHQWREKKPVSHGLTQMKRS